MKPDTVGKIQMDVWEAGSETDVMLKTQSLRGMGKGQWRKSRPATLKAWKIEIERNRAPVVKTQGLIVGDAGKKGQWNVETTSFTNAVHRGSVQIQYMGVGEVQGGGGPPPGGGDNPPPPPGGGDNPPPPPGGDNPPSPPQVYHVPGLIVAQRG
jgi:hypothetical protein